MAYFDDDYCYDYDYDYGDHEVCFDDDPYCYAHDYDYEEYLDDDAYYYDDDSQNEACVDELIDGDESESSSGKVRQTEDNTFVWDTIVQWNPNMDFHSPEFSHRGITWVLKVFPCGRNKNKKWTSKNTCGWFEIALCARGPPDILKNKPLSIRFRVNGKNGEIINFIPKKRRKWYVTNKVIKSKEIRKKIGCNSLTVVCEINNEESAKSVSAPELPIVDYSQASTSSNSNGPSMSHNCMEKNGNTSGVSTHTRTETGIGAEKHSEANAPCASEHRSTLPKGVAKALEDYKELLLRERHCDITIKVRNKEFKAHKGILAARNPVFAAMLEHNMKEKATGVVTIEDIDPEVFPDFLEYLYTGQVQNLSPGSALQLFTAADKYQIDELKEECLVYMKGNLSVENFCSILSLSLRHNEKELIAVATRFFVENAVDIVTTPIWQIFMSENLVAANELLIKQLHSISKTRRKIKSFTKNSFMKYLYLFIFCKMGCCCSNFGDSGINNLNLLSVYYNMLQIS